MIKKYKLAPLIALAAGLLALPSAGVAGDTTDTSKDKAVVIPPSTDRLISGDAGVSFISQYISRGLVLNNEGAISQDYADLYFALYQSKGFIDKVQANIGIWFDFDPHSTQAGTAKGGTGTNVTLPWWYEFDFTPGLSITFDKIFTFNPSYYVFTSPSSAFHTFQGANLNLGIDDSGWMGKFALHPSFTFLRELRNKAGDGKEEGDYYEIGITPSTAIGPATLSIPVTVGFGSNQFYGHNAGFGYVTPGVQVAVPLKFIPSAYGTWTATALYKFYYLGHDLANFNTEPGPSLSQDDSVRHPTHYENVFSGGLSLTF